MLPRALMALDGVASVFGLWMGGDCRVSATTVTRKPQPPSEVRRETRACQTTLARVLKARKTDQLAGMSSTNILDSRAPHSGLFGYDIAQDVGLSRLMVVGARAQAP